MFISTMSCRLTLLFLVATAQGADLETHDVNRWQHSWNSTSEMTFVDFASAYTPTDDQVSFVGSKYRIVSLEKCSGSANGTQTEDYIYSMAMRLKKEDPNTKVQIVTGTHALLHTDTTHTHKKTGDFLPGNTC
jgi:hypothetical protein